MRRSHLFNVTVHVPHEDGKAWRFLALILLSGYRKQNWMLRLDDVCKVHGFWCYEEDNVVTLCL